MADDPGHRLIGKAANFTSFCPLALDVKALAAIKIEAFGVFLHHPHSTDRIEIDADW